MFVDIVNIHVKAGDGGNGAVSFHRERCVTSGGPDGGDGGKGGDIIFQIDENLSTLVSFEYKKKFKAESGQSGGKNRCCGKSGKDLIIKVPKGTLIRNAQNGKLLADMSSIKSVVIASGGKGGWGNQHFATSKKQTPRFAKPGTTGEECDLMLELKLLADVGLIGFPNVGKSTFLSIISDAKPKIANYHFTTIVPTLGVVKLEEEKSFVVADIPGLIEGASQGIGLGHEFLRHIDRCRLLIHIVDVAGVEDRNAIDDFNKINKELKQFNDNLFYRPQIVVANKCDIATNDNIFKFKNYIKNLGYKFYEISAVTGKGIKEVIYSVSKILEELPPIKEYEPDVVSEIESVKRNRKEFKIIKNEDAYVIEADWLFNILSSVDLEDYESLHYFQRVLKTSGIENELKSMGIKDGDTVRIFNLEFEYLR